MRQLLTNIIAYLVIGIMLCFFFYKIVLEDYYHRLLLIEKGVPFIALVTGYDIGDGEPVELVYEFKVNDVPYRGYFINPRTNEDIGDTVDIYLLLNDPSISALRREVDIPMLRTLKKWRGR